MHINVVINSTRIILDISQSWFFSYSGPKNNSKGEKCYNFGMDFTTKCACTDDIKVHTHTFNLMGIL